MKRLLVATLLALTLTSCSSSALPWKTFSESAKDVKTAGTAGICVTDGEMVEVLGARLENGGNAYKYFTDGKTVVFLVFVGNKPDAAPDYVLYGTVDPAKHDEIPSLTKLSIEEAKAKYPSLCDLFNPHKA